jgi:RNA polymerase sigma-70 factor (ECF subfamily)
MNAHRADRLPLHDPSNGEAGLTSVEDDKLAAFIETSERYRSRLLWVALRVANRREEAEDIVQTALLKALGHLSNFRGDAQMSTWLCAIVFNVAHEYVRKQRGKVFVSLHSPQYRESDGEELEIADSSLNPEEDFVRLEGHTLLFTAAQKLNPWQRNLLEMCVFEGLSYVRVASILNVSVSSVKSRVFRCKRILKLEISALGGFRR